MLGKIVSSLTIGSFLKSPDYLHQGKCPRNNDFAVKNFDVKAYTGLWYEFARDRDMPFEDGDCGTATYTLMEGGVVDVNNRGYHEDGTLYNLHANAEVQKPGTGKLFVYEKGEKMDFKAESNYQVVDTDYKNYAIVYACGTIIDDDNMLGVPGQFWDFQWYLTRKNLLSDQEDKELDRKSNKLGFVDADRMKRVNHINCYYGY